MTELLVPRRFCGPPSSGNGGWTAGALAALLALASDHAEPWPAVTVSLLRPPPLEVEMPVSAAEDVLTAMHGEDVVATAQASVEEVAVVEPVPPDEARAAEATFAGLLFHPFPTCFVCGTAREPGDGLRIFPGRVSDQDGAARTAATWTPHPSVAEGYRDTEGTQRASIPATWAALDCVGGWAGDLDERLMVLARMTAQVDALPAIGEEHVVVGLTRGSEGRKTRTASAVYDADGRVVARAEHLWVAVNPADFA